MVKLDTSEGVVDNTLWRHYDIENDVLYLRRVAERETVAYSEETDDGLLLERREDNDELVGMTIVGWWKRFGEGTLPDSIHELERAIEPWARRFTA